MELKKKIVRTGTSLGIVLDKVILDSLDLKEGNYVVVNIKKAKK
ncbi:MAG: hypothetical protein ABIH28_03330 [archaeon]